MPIGRHTNNLILKGCVFAGYLVFFISLHPITTWISCPLAIRLVAVFPMLHSTQICSHSTFSEYQADSVAHHKTECITAVGVLMLHSVHFQYYTLLLGNHMFNGTSFSSLYLELVSICKLPGILSCTGTGSFYMATTTTHYDSG